jgi:glutamate racemase
MHYLADLGDIDTLLLGCTHYPLLRPAFEACARVKVLDPAPHVADRLADWLARHPGFDAPGSGTLRFACTGDPALFAAHGARFLGAPLGPVAHLDEQSGRLLPLAEQRILRGQVLR